MALGLFSKQVNKQKVALGMSGGVDSSVAAHLLLKQGYDVVGVFIQCWDEKADGCKADEDRAYAAKTAAKLGIKFEHLDFRDQYKSKVMNYFYTEYLMGRTPNPDVICNKEIKFGLFYEWALEHHFDFVATGHYARIKKNKLGKYELLKGKDSAKDQSYFLYLLDQNRLAHTLFPLGDMKKSAVRRLAKKLNLPSAVRPDSMGICFIGKVNVRDFLKKRLEEKEGEVVDLNGDVIGNHEGVWFYTIGQRHGFKLSKYFGKPMYVVSKDISTNRLVIGAEKDTKLKYFEVENVHWLSGGPLRNRHGARCQVRIRHLGQMLSVDIARDGGIICVKSATPVFAVAPGQSAVFYDGDVVLGGGIIKQAVRLSRVFEKLNQ